ncbi:hypothetical protein DL764_000061 [Monosporascus ibericus]|uniref:Uncharacterized protein n=1 Tax=Monosporascus ibericus TaxID=155417 RepID=A0A4Q4TYH4_9PEZI|nr:hypothetical protein DL764_000061 [Monosporascus ibericus]
MSVDFRLSSPEEAEAQAGQFILGTSCLKTGSGEGENSELPSGGIGFDGRSRAALNHLARITERFVTTGSTSVLIRGPAGAQREQNEQKKGEEKAKKTYNTRDSLVVTDPTTDLAVSGLSRGERTGSRVFQILWSIQYRECIDDKAVVVLARVLYRQGNVEIDAINQYNGVAAMCSTRQKLPMQSFGQPSWGKGSCLQALQPDKRPIRTNVSVELQSRDAIMA